MFISAVIIFGASKSLVGIAELSLPPTFEQPPVTPIFSIHSFCQGGVLALDVHPSKRYLAACFIPDQLLLSLSLSLSLSLALFFLSRSLSLSLFRNLVLCGSMDRLVFILDLSKPDDSMMVQKFESHSKYGLNGIC